MNAQSIPMSNSQPQSLCLSLCVCLCVYHWAQPLINNQKSQHLKNVTFDIFRLHQMPNKSEREEARETKNALMFSLRLQGIRAHSSLCWIKVLNTLLRI